MESVIYNGDPGAHDASAFGETDMPQAGQPVGRQSYGKKIQG
jgi:hypothetical protein